MLSSFALMAEMEEAARIAELKAARMTHNKGISNIDEIKLWLIDK